MTKVNQKDMDVRWKIHYIEHGTVVVVVCFHDLKCFLTSQLKAASCVWCTSEMPPSKQVNGHSFTICLIVWCSPQSQSGEAMYYKPPHMHAAAALSRAFDRNLFN